MKIKQKYSFIILILLPTFCFAEGQQGMEYFIWIQDFVKVFFFWIVGTIILLEVIKKIREKSLSVKQKFIIWLVMLFLAFFNWSMITYDSHPTEGPIDSFVWKSKVQLKKISDSLEAEKYLKNLEDTTKTNDFVIRIKLSTQDADSTSGNMRVTKNGIFYKEINSDGNRYPIKLDLNSFYLFTCSKSGYNTKVIYFDTKVPLEREKEEFARFIVDVELLKKVQGEKVDTIKPIGGVRYFPDQEDFNVVKK